MSGPIFPDVPNVPGVPAVRRLANSISPTEAPLSSDSITVTATARDQWGIFTVGGAKALEPDSIMSIGFDAESRIADFPVEEGGFESYDKVALPFQSRVVMTKGGSVSDRRDFLSALEDMRTDLELYNVVTPERTYLNANISRVSSERNREQGANLITVEIVLQEIRQNVTTTFTASQPSAASTTSNGIVQAKDADAATKAVAETKSAATAAIGGKPFFSSAAGQVLKTIAISAGVPAQALAVQLAGKTVGIDLLQKATGLYANVALGGKAIVAGVLCRDATRLINGAHLGFPGDLALIDMQGSADPDYSGLGSRFQLLWAS